jgi:regulator of protease activity HflC (stomatin/prohibitin superfamily)
LREENNVFEIFGGIIVLTIMVVLSGIKVVKEHDRLVVFRYGKAILEKGPGVQLVLPMIDKAQVVDTRIITLPSHLIQAMTLDSMSVKVSVLCMYQIVDAKKAVTKVENISQAARELSEMALRTAVGNSDLRHLVSDRKRINFNLKNILDRQTKDFGIRIYKIELKDVRLSRDMRKALARQEKHGSKLLQTNANDHSQQSLHQEHYGDLMKRLG